MLRPTRAHRRIAAALTATALTFALAACGDDDGKSGGENASSVHTAPNGDTYNDADVEFATSMIPHHAQAIQMVTLTDTRTLDPDVEQLAESIRAAQAPEVETMVDWLTAWGKDIPETSNDHVNGGHDMGDMPDMANEDMPGMMSAEQMQQLMDAPDADFQDMWLQMMKEHHEGAIEMAKSEQADGEFPEAVEMAKSIVTSQQAEIDQIDALLAS